MRRIAACAGLAALATVLILIVPPYPSLAVSARASRPSPALLRPAITSLSASRAIPGEQLVVTGHRFSRVRGVLLISGKRRYIDVHVRVDEQGRRLRLAVPAVPDSHYRFQVVAAKGLSNAKTLIVARLRLPNSYRAGELCSPGDVGFSVHASVGVLTCVRRNGKDRWELTSSRSTPTPTTVASPPPTTSPTRPSPVPVGCSGQAVGSTCTLVDANGNAFAVTLDSVTTAATDLHGFRPNTGGSGFIVVQMTIADTGTGIVSDNAYLDVSITGSDGQYYGINYADDVGTTSCADFDHGVYQLSPGQAVTGCILFDPPAGIGASGVQFTPSTTDPADTAGWQVAVADPPTTTTTTTTTSTTTTTVPTTTTTSTTSTTTTVPTTTTTTVPTTTTTTTVPTTTTTSTTSTTTTTVPTTTTTSVPTTTTTTTVPTTTTTSTTSTTTTTSSTTTTTLAPPTST